MLEKLNRASKELNDLSWYWHSCLARDGLFMTVHVCLVLIYLSVLIWQICLPFFHFAFVYLKANLLLILFWKHLILWADWSRMCLVWKSASTKSYRYEFKVSYKVKCLIKGIFEGKYFGALVIQLWIFFHAYLCHAKNFREKLQFLKIKNLILLILFKQD